MTTDNTLIEALEAIRTRCKNVGEYGIAYDLGGIIRQHIPRTDKPQCIMVGDNIGNFITGEDTNAFDASNDDFWFKCVCGYSLKKSDYNGKCDNYCPKCNRLFWVGDTTNQIIEIYKDNQFIVLKHGVNDSHLGKGSDNTYVGEDNAAYSSNDKAKAADSALSPAPDNTEVDERAEFEKGRFSAHRTLWRQWRGESNMEVRETDRWMIGFCERYINEVEEQFTRELSFDQIDAFFEMPIAPRLRQPAKPAVVSEWMPIETAPRNGDCFLCSLFPTEANGLSRDPDIIIAWYDQGHYRNMDFEPLKDNKMWQPTHWMPLPAPPLKAQGVELKWEGEE